MKFGIFCAGFVLGIALVVVPMDAAAFKQACYASDRGADELASLPCAIVFFHPKF